MQCMKDLRVVRVELRGHFNEGDQGWLPCGLDVRAKTNDEEEEATWKSMEKKQSEEPAKGILRKKKLNDAEAQWGAGRGNMWSGKNHMRSLESGKEFACILMMGTQRRDLSRGMLWFRLKKDHSVESKNKAKEGAVKRNVLRFYLLYVCCLFSFRVTSIGHF